ncbi:MAG: polysaccharide pyruvyl transferase family protein [Planctomycetaceae bacterium]|nr:polysaccharide pyruvyl transferase family protein [Planctomycetaceae bacterium]
MTFHFAAAGDCTARPLFLFVGNGSCANRGCEAILRGTMAILRKEFGACTFVNMGPLTLHAADPDLRQQITRRFSKEWIFRQLGKVLKRDSWIRYGSLLSNAAAVFALGGDNVSLDYGPVLPKTNFDLADAAVSGGKPFLLWGASIGPFDKQPDFERIAVQRLKRFTRLCVRESCTQEYLASRGIVDNVVTMSDPAFVMAPEPCELPPEIERILATGEAIGVNLSNLVARFRTSDVRWEDVAGACLQELDKRLGRPIVLVPHVMTPKGNDHVFLASVMNLLRDVPIRNQVVLVGPDYSAPQYKWIVSRLSLFIGARTHATIAAISSYIPTISIGYSMKAKGINRDVFGDVRWLIPVADLTPSRLTDLADTALQKGASIRAGLRDVMPGYINKAWQAGSLVREVIDDCHNR